MSNLEKKIKNLIRVMQDKRGHLNVLPPLDLLLGEIFSDQRKQSEDREGLCEQLLHQGDKLRSCSTSLLTQMNLNNLVCVISQGPTFFRSNSERFAGHHPPDHVHDGDAELLLDQRVLLLFLLAGGQQMVH